MSTTTTQRLAVVSLTLQNATVFLLLRASRYNATYLTASHIFVGEVLKLVTSLLLLARVRGASTLSDVGSAFAAGRDMQLASVPGLLYSLQNAMMVVASTHLDAATIGVLNQGKLLTTALFSVTILGTELRPQQWQALGVLCVGIICVQLSMTVKPGSTPPGDDQEGGAPGGSVWFGSVLMLIATTLSGFNVVYTEAMLKRKPMLGVEADLWMNNIKLASYGILFSGVSLVVTEWGALSTGGLLQGFTPIVWASAIDSSMGGLLVSLCVRYTDSVVKTFATTVATVLSAVFSVMFLNAPLRPLFVVGSALVFVAVYMFIKGKSQAVQYRKAPPQQATATSPSPNPNQNNPLPNRLTAALNGETTLRSRRRVASGGV